MPSITYTVPAEKYQEYKRLFLITYPNQTTDWETPLTDDQWIKYRGFLFFKGAYTKAKQQEYDEQNGPVLDLDIVAEG